MLIAAFTDTLNSLNSLFLVNDKIDNNYLQLISKESILRNYQFRGKDIHSLILCENDEQDDLHEVFDVLNLRQTSTRIVTSKNTVYLCSPITKHSGEIIGYVLLYGKNQLSMDFLPFVEALSKCVYAKYQLLFIDQQFIGHCTDYKKEYNLTNKELDILKLISEGKTDREISEALHHSISTLRKHIDNVFYKTGCSNRAALSAVYYQHIIYNMLNL